MSVVTAITPASSTDAAAWFRHKLSLETDCADVYSAMREEDVD
ncbi:TPA: rhodanese-like domain-containing protein, partial [Klebsiella oxytoca]|nr:rhodanese-like domain-containing protein [Klebsiella oxytoca]